MPAGTGVCVVKRQPPRTASIDSGYDSPDSVTSWRMRSSPRNPARSEEHTSELQSLMRISYAVFCLKKKKIQNIPTNNTHNTTPDNETPRQTNKLHTSSNTNKP